MKIGHMLPAHLISKIGPLEAPIVEAMKLRLTHEDATQTRTFIDSFMQSPHAKPFLENVDGQPGIFVVDSQKPLNGLQALGFEAADQLTEELELDQGDMVVIQARRDVPLSGGSTAIGRLRLALHKAAVVEGLVTAPKTWGVLWINDFPLFSPSDDSEPGQGGVAGMSSTHHPFTAPASVSDIDLLATDPLACRAEHYDLVVNGVELGGGSRRIHDPRLQSYILRNVLKVSEEKMGDFAHLLSVLGSGCPPHAGFALGFDRLCAVMLGKESIRDVIAFPKTGSGEDAMVQSPSRVTAEQLQLYHLELRKDGEGEG